MKRYELYLVLSCMMLHGSLIIAGEKPDQLGKSGNSSRKLSDSQELALKAEAAAAMRDMYFDYPGSKEVHYRGDAIRNQMKPWSDHLNDCPK